MDQRLLVSRLRPPHLACGVPVALHNPCFACSTANTTALRPGALPAAMHFPAPFAVQPIHPYIGRS